MAERGGLGLPGTRSFPTLDRFGKAMWELRCMDEPTDLPAPVVKLDITADSDSAILGSSPGRSTRKINRLASAI